MRFRQWAGGVLVTSPRLQRGGYLVPRLGFFRFSTISWFRVGGGEDGAAAADAETSGVLLSSCRLYCVNCQFSTSRYRRVRRALVCLSVHSSMRSLPSAKSSWPFLTSLLKFSAGFPQTSRLTKVVTFCSWPWASV